MKIKLTQNTGYTAFFAYDENGQLFVIDPWIDGGLEAPKDVMESSDPEVFPKWIKSLEGKTIECEEIRPHLYTTVGEVKIVTLNNITS